MNSRERREAGNRGDARRLQMQRETQNSIHAIPKKGDGEGHIEATEIDIEWWFRGNERSKESEEKRFNENE